MIDKSAVIHPSSIIEEGAVIGANVRIGPFALLVQTLRLEKVLISNLTLLSMGIHVLVEKIRFTNSLLSVKLIRI